MPVAIPMEVVVPWRVVVMITMPPEVPGVVIEVAGIMPAWVTEMEVPVVSTEMAMMAMKVMMAMVMAPLSRSRRRKTDHRCRSDHKPQQPSLKT